MIKAELKLPDGRSIKVLIRERHYRKMTTKISKMSFLQKLKVLFFGIEK